MRYAALDASKLSVPSKKKNGTRCAVNAVDAVRDGLTSLWVLQSTKQVHECGQGGKEAVVSSSERREASASKAGAKGRANLRAVRVLASKRTRAWIRPSKMCRSKDTADATVRTDIE